MDSTKKYKIYISTVFLHNFRNDKILLNNIFNL